MDSKAVEAFSLGLRYRVRSEEYRTLKLALVALIKHKVRRKDFWALDDVSFSIGRGESCGIIGVNGSGKSTLLKLITGILRPDHGKLNVHGQVSALLELGAGFQPDLTGRENIFLNGSLIGLAHREIQNRLDDIIKFSGIGAFIDTPVKHYSSGMYMRLGFSIAVNVDPDILLIDEIFAVGDLNFQEKCMERIKEFKARQKTIILVAHDLNAIRSLCDTAIWLEQGKLMKMGPVVQVIDFYKNYLSEHKEVYEQLTSVAEKAQRWGTRTVSITEVNLTDEHGIPQTYFRFGQSLHCHISYHAQNKVANPVFGVAIHRVDGVHICGPNTQLDDVPIDSIEGEGKVTYCIPKLPLLPGKYLLSAVIYDSSCVIPYDHLDRMFPFHMLEEGSSEIFGIVSLDGCWTVEPAE